VPLSGKLNLILMTRPCQKCGHELKKPGRWFAFIQRYKCEGCGIVVQMTYPEKVALFAAHGGLTNNPT
jgi:hypothetical protein